MHPFFLARAAACLDEGLKGIFFFGGGLFFPVIVTFALVHLTGIPVHRLFNFGLQAIFHWYMFLLAVPSSPCPLIDNSFPISLQNGQNKFAGLISP